MSKEYSEDFIKELNTVSGGERPLVLLEVTHDALASPIRIVQDNQDVTHNGNTFQAMAFEITLPNDPSTGMPQAQLAVDNVGREMVTWLEVANFSLPTTVRIIQILRSDPDTIEFETTMDLRDIRMTQSAISGVLTYENFFSKPAVVTIYNKHSSPALY